MKLILNLQLVLQKDSNEIVFLKKFIINVKYQVINLIQKIVGWVKR